MGMLDRLFSKERAPMDPVPDHLRELIETAHAQTSQSWEVVNESRARRGQPPKEPVIPRSWEELFGKKTVNDSPAD